MLIVAATLRRMNRLPLLVLCIAVGLATGVGAYTFRYAEGLSHLSREPSACMNCHIMRPQFDAWQKSSHHSNAVCVDCHLPQSFVAKYLAKLENGYRHSKEFTAQTFPEPIRVRARGLEILQENCVHCHADVTHSLLTPEIRCLHCHAGVGHGERAGLGGPLHYAREE